MVKAELTIAETNNDNEYFDLETLINESVNERTPIEIEFPDGRKAQALIRPIGAGEFQTIYTKDPDVLLVNVLKIALMKNNGEPLDTSLIEAMPIGLPIKIVKQIFENSGIQIKGDDIQEAVKQLEVVP